MLRPKQVAVMLGCSLSNVYALIEAGALPAISIGAGGKGYRVIEADLQSFVENRKRNHTPVLSPPQSRTTVKRVDWKKLREGWKR